MRGTAEVLRAVNIQDDQCKSSCYFARCWVVRIDLTWLSRYRASQTDDATEEEERLADCERPGEKSSAWSKASHEEA